MCATEVRVLGEVEIRVGGRVLALGPPRQRRLLAALLVEPNVQISTGELISRVWNGSPPPRVHNALYSYVSRLRAVFQCSDRLILTRGHRGYVLIADDDDVDLCRFRALVSRARQPGGDRRRAKLAYETALSLCRGVPFVDVDAAWLADLRCRFAAERLGAELDLFDICLREGRSSELLGPLNHYAAEHPLDERIAAQLMTVLCRHGRQADALRRYAGLSRRLRNELGVDPGARLVALHCRILSGACP
ncbi:AfsR/SARP family transcriptional regulator [Amycolatopsis silviterrae]|uniref:BTAD domain-containing putative transcriptional regulator n=1 Tax=Amycolatopsis silviterrae TaxID=1656914 RepID=A0ABW5HG63_9PSEU